MNWRERERSSFVYFSGVQRTRLALLLITASFLSWLCISLHYKVSSSIRIHALWPLLLLLSLAWLLLSAFAEPLLVFPHSLLVFVSLIACLTCLYGRGLVRANRHALPATLGLAVLPSCLRSNRARTRLLACSSWASLRMIFSFSILNLISTHTLFIADQPRWHNKDTLESKSIMNQL